MQRQNPPVCNPWNQRLLILLAGGLFTAAPSLRAQTDWDNLSASRSKPPPHVGMTREEAHKLYGEPFQRAAVANGERWWYRLKYNEVYGRAWVPFMTNSDNVRLGNVEFGPNGRVRAFDWQRPAPR